MIDKLGIIWIYALLVVISYLDYVRGYELPKWKMSQHCGETIGPGHFAGGLVFEADSLPVQPGSDFDECIVTVAPSATMYEDSSRVLFYFTSFDILGDCEDTNVTIINGDSRGLLNKQRIYPIPVDRVVSGLPTTMCGTHSIILQRYQVFYPSTSPGVFTVVFRRNHRKYHTSRYSGKFTIKFASYKEGSCPYTSAYHSCSNERCINPGLSCQDEINACGAEDDFCDIKETREGMTNKTLEYLEKFWYIYLIFIGLVAIQAYRKLHGYRSGCIKRIWYSLCDLCHCACDFNMFKEARDSIRTRIFGPPVTEEPTGMTSRGSERSDNDDDDDDNREEDSLCSESTYESARSGTEQNDVSSVVYRYIPPADPTDPAPSYAALFPIPPLVPSAPPTPACQISPLLEPPPPPPSYTDYIENEHVYMIQTDV